MYNILIIGPTGVGKSTLLNRLLNKEVSKIGYSAKPETLKLKSYPLTSQITIWDSPGLGDGVKDKKFERKLRKLLKESDFIDRILLIIDISDKRITTIIKLINIIVDIDKKYENKFSVILNKVDTAKNIRYWNDEENKPSPLQHQFIKEKESDYRKRINESTGIKLNHFLYCSAQLDYNLHTISNSLYSLIFKQHLRER